MFDYHSLRKVVVTLAKQSMHKNVSIRSLFFSLIFLEYNNLYSVTKFFDKYQISFYLLLRTPKRHAAVHFFLFADCCKFVIYNCGNWDIREESSAHKPKWGKKTLNLYMTNKANQITNTKYCFVHTYIQIHKGILWANTYCTVLTSKILWFC